MCMYCGNLIFRILTFTKFECERLEDFLEVGFGVVIRDNLVMLIVIIRLYITSLTFRVCVKKKQKLLGLYLLGSELSKVYIIGIGVSELSILC